MRSVGPRRLSERDATWQLQAKKWKMPELKYVAPFALQGPVSGCPITTYCTFIIARWRIREESSVALRQNGQNKSYAINSIRFAAEYDRAYRAYRWN